MVCHDPPLTHCIFVGSSSFDEDEQVPFPWLFSLFRTETLRDPHTALLPLEIAFHGIPFDLLSKGNPPARLRIRRAKGFKGSAFHPTALKLASDQATASLKILQWLLITPRKKDSSFLWLALSNLFSLITHCSPVSQPCLDPSESRDPSCFRILLILFPLVWPLFHPMTFLLYSFFHHQVNHYFIRKTFYNTLDEFKSFCILLLKQLHLLFQSIYRGLELCI